MGAAPRWRRGDQGAGAKLKAWIALRLSDIELGMLPPKSWIHGIGWVGGWGGAPDHVREPSGRRRGLQWWLGRTRDANQKTDA
jgi:hypothetical protein